MSTVRLLKDCDRGKKGEAVSVPFGTGREMVAAGVGEYPPAAPAASGRPNVAVPTVAERHAGELARLNALHAQALKDVREDAEAEAKKALKVYADETAKLKAELDAAHKTIAELNAAAKPANGGGAKK